MLIPVTTAYSRVVHVLESEKNHGWSEGKEARTVCGRIHPWHMLVSAGEADRPCKRCDEVSNVAIAIFDVEEKMAEALSESVRRHDDEDYDDEDYDDEDPHVVLRNRMDQGGWLQYGMMRGFILPPECFPHDGMVLAPWEYEHLEDEGELPCVHYLRFFPSV